VNARCQTGPRLRSFRGMLYEEPWPEVDRNYWRPCTRLGSKSKRRGRGAYPAAPPVCRGHVSLRTRLWNKTASLQWVHPSLSGVEWWVEWATQRVAQAPYRCAQ
jgi:hypothetical protein